MSKIYITGHRNPDLDSLCSASAYARLKNLTDPENEYIAVHCSPVSDSVRRQMEEMELAQNAEIKSLIKEHKELMAKREAVLLEREAEVTAREMMLYVKDSAQRTLGVGSIAQA